MEQVGPNRGLPKPYVRGVTLSTSVAAPSRTLPYAVVDVFAERALAGNPLAIFLDGRGLSTAEMQALACETNLSETTFILPREPAIERAHGVQVRIFTTVEELSFAGHPTLGTAAWLYQNAPAADRPDTITLDLRAGPIPVRFATAQTEDPGVFGTMRQMDPTFGAIGERDAVAAALGLRPDDLDPDLPPQTVSTGLPFCIVPLRSLEVAGRLQIPQAPAQAYLAGAGARFFFCITRAAPASGAHWHARMQFYSAEDPATGSASGCAIAYLVRHGAARSQTPVLLEQGIEIGRPSRIHLQARLDGDRVTDVFVGGRTVPVASGHFFLP